ncbi:hypothetical protein C7401_1122 [Paraburkholderia unamae]|uniref:hypothetical protein n=1 Tax=Paraburkholderia unamae TaxID=219649 RepID=UPI000DC22831|nr:hypothetical protein [Paraburkholderia unamae]RAR58688.1 hypothetical protein C7401_1122 [Paraburkholderia unamae]
MSYNGLTVPLDCGAWNCELVPAVEYRSPSGVPLRFISGDELKALEDANRTFVRHFRPGYDFRRTIAADIDALRSFLRDHLSFAYWNQPTDNPGIERILKQAVVDGRVVPVIDRDRLIPVRTERVPHAPQCWGETYRTGWGGMAASMRPKTFHQSVMESMGLDAEGATAYIEKYNAMVQRMDAVQTANAARRAVTAAASNSNGLLGPVEPAVGAVFGDNDSDGGDDAGGAGDNLFSDVAGDTLTPLGDAQPFAYEPDAISGDVEELAKSTMNERYAARMLGYDMDTFGGMIHALKDQYSLRGDDNITFHDSGDVSFNGEWLDNIHAYAP